MFTSTQESFLQCGISALLTIKRLKKTVGDFIALFLKRNMEWYKQNINQTPKSSQPKSNKNLGSSFLFACSYRTKSKCFCI